MARLHYWQYIVNEEGEPVENATIRFYLASTETDANIFLHPTAGSYTTSTDTNLKTNGNGFVEVWFGDNNENIGGYTSDQKFKITWTKAGGLEGYIDNIDIFPSFFQVDETDNTSGDKNKKNKLVSNELAYNWNSHVNKQAIEGPHGFAAVDQNDTDNTYNKLVSNSLMNYVFSVLTSGGTISIDASGSTVRTFSITSWNTSGDFYYYTNIDHFLANAYPIVNIMNSSTNEQIIPYKIITINDDRLQIWVTSNDNISVTLIG